MAGGSPSGGCGLDEHHPGATSLYAVLGNARAQHAVQFAFGRSTSLGRVPAQEPASQRERAPRAPAFGGRPPGRAC